MGSKREVKLLALALLFLCACVAVFGRDTTEQHRKGPPLRNIFQQIEGYSLQRNLTLSEEHLKMLKLDDYVFADYVGKNSRVNLYIGYYYTANKAYAAHSPTICYPAQGWKIDTAPTSGTLTIGSRNINYEEITISVDGQNELILYWHQARLNTNTQFYMNKIDMGYNKLAYNEENHGFVRVAVPFTSSNYEMAKKTATDFVNSFYPLFIGYITNGIKK